MTFSSPTCLVTGAAGSVGKVLVARLLEQGFEVFALARDRGEADSVPKGAQTIEGDILSPELFQEKIGSINSVFHLAGLTEAAEVKPDNDEEYYRVNVEGTRKIFEVARKGKAKRLIYFSSIHVYGGNLHGVADEDSEPDPLTPYAKSKLLAERVLVEHAVAEGSLEITILRFAAIYGPNMKGNYPRMVKALDKGRFIPIGNGMNRRSLIFIDDAVDAAILAVAYPKAGNSIYNVSDGERHSVNEITETICRALGRRPPRIHIPRKVALTGAKVLDGFANISGKSLCLANSVERFTEEAAVSSRKIQEELGFQPKFDLQRGWNIIVDAWREEGLLRSRHN